MLEWHLERVSPEAIVGRLTAIGAFTQQGRAWSLATVQKTLAIMVRAGAGDVHGHVAHAFRHELRVRGPRKGPLLYLGLYGSSAQE
jgi:hypothetical protein